MFHYRWFSCVGRAGVVRSGETCVTVCLEQHAHLDESSFTCCDERTCVYLDTRCPAAKNLRSVKVDASGQSACPNGSTRAADDSVSSRLT